MNKKNLYIDLCIIVIIGVTLLMTPLANAQSTHFTNQHKYHKHHHGKKTGYAFPQTRAASGNRIFIFNPRSHAWAAYDANGELVRTGRASGGKSYCPDIRRGCRTIVGTYHIQSKEGPHYRSKKYPVRTGGGAPMPYCMRFHPKGYAIHGSNSVPHYNASHGCIRVPTPDARWLSQNFVQHGTTVVVMPY